MDHYTQFSKWQSKRQFANDNPTQTLTVNFEKHEPCCYNLPIAKQQNAVCGLRFAVRINRHMKDGTVRSRRKFLRTVKF